jgi:DNA repair protein SbcD/Mre11
MPLNILHTADWHLGQSFYEFDRSYEHTCFLDWLVRTIQEKEVDVLLISGDIFDVSNPSAASTRMFYNFLKEATSAQKNLQVVCIAGNHDSPARLESPKTLLEAFNVSVTGAVTFSEEKAIDFEKLAIPLRGKSGEVEAWCLAVPFLRPGDYPNDKGYAGGVASVYHDGVAYLEKIRQPGQALLAMGHLHTLDARITEDDKSERKISGGLEYVPASAFSEKIAYTALGHIHRPQEVGGRRNVRYAGSPLPMSFSELHYQHQTVLVAICEGEVKSIEPVGIPVTAKLISVPFSPQPLQKVLEELRKLEENNEKEQLSPYLQVRVKLDGPEPSLRHQVEGALAGKAVRLAKIEVTYPNSNDTERLHKMTAADLQKLRPLQMFERKYKARYDNDVPGELVSLFNEVIDGLNGETSE